MRKSLMRKMEEQEEKSPDVDVTKSHYNSLGWPIPDLFSESKINSYLDN